MEVEANQYPETEIGHEPAVDAKEVDEKQLKVEGKNQPMVNEKEPTVHEKEQTVNEKEQTVNEKKPKMEGGKTRKNKE